MVFLWDAAEYQALGEMLHRQGWRFFLSTGPHREPLYPLLVAQSLRLGELFALPYQKVVVAIQFGLVAVTQLLMIRLARLLAIPPWAALAAVAYFGLSPAVVNSACSMFSEVLAYPFVAAAALGTTQAWQASARGAIGRSATLAAASGLAFAGGALTKGLLAYVGLLVAVFFGLRAALALRRGTHRPALANSIVALIGLALALGTLHAYKALNRHFNGNYEFTTRYVGMLYGNAAKRAMPMTARQLLAHLVAIPGGTVCQLLFTREECEFCEFGAADELWLTELPRRLEGVPPGERRAATLRLVREKVLEAPFRYAFVGLTQMLRLPFWESTQLGYVSYPPWLQRVWAAGAVRFGLRLLVGVATLAALGWAAWIAMGLLFRPSHPQPPFAPTLVLVAAFMLLYAPYSVLTRYALPLAPLYLVLVAAMLARLARRGAAAGADATRTTPRHP